MKIYSLIRMAVLICTLPIVQSCTTAKNNAEPEEARVPLSGNACGQTGCLEPYKPSERGPYKLNSIEQRQKRDPFSDFDTDQPSDMGMEMKIGIQEY